MTAAERTKMAIELLDPRELVEHPRNVRGDLGDLTGLTASIAAQGVIEPITVVPLADGGHQVVAGHRRTAAAIAAGLEQVPCVVRADLAASAEDNAGQAVHIGAMLAENLHREGLTAVEEARGVQSMLDLGVPLSKVAKSTGLDQKRVKKALGVARLDEGTADMVADMGLTLDQAAVVALYADDPETSTKLAVAAQEGSGRFAHAVAQAKQDREVEQKYAAKLDEVRTSGVAIAESVDYGGRKNRRLVELEHDGKQLTEKSHADCPGHAVYVGKNWNGPFTVEVCTDFGKHGHTDRYASSSAGASAKPETEEEKEAAKAERRKVIENNKAMAAANGVRRAWVKELLARRTAPPEVLRFAVEEISQRPQVFSWWLMGNSAPGDKDAAEQLGLVPPVRPWSASAQTEKRTTLTTGEQVPDGRLPLQLLAHVAGAIELGIGKDSWRKADHRHTELVRWLRFLAGLGYTLSDVEQLVVDGAAK